LMHTVPTLPCDCTRDHTQIIAERYDLDAETGCWVWRLSVDAGGYGSLTHRANGRPKRFRAHRFAYEAYRELIPYGLTLDHLCRVRRCVNPYHLEAVLLHENWLRGTARAVGNLRKTHCIRGHDLPPSMPGAKRVCPKCARSIADNPDDPAHGTHNGYVNLRCRCQRCRTAWWHYWRASPAGQAREAKRAAERKARAEERANRPPKVKQPLSPDDPRHGTHNGYANWKCRCEPCLEAAREYRKANSRAEYQREWRRKRREASTPGGDA
jgi:hypothetical protein